MDCFLLSLKAYKCFLPCMTTCWTWPFITCSCWKDKKKKWLSNVKNCFPLHCESLHCPLSPIQTLATHWHPPLTGPIRTHIGSITHNPRWPRSVRRKHYQTLAARLRPVIVVCQESKNPLLWDQLSGATASAEWPFYCPQSMYSCPERHNILAPKQGYLTAFHSVVFFFIVVFLLYMTYSIF